MIIYANLLAGFLTAVFVAFGGVPPAPEEPPVPAETHVLEAEAAPETKTKEVAFAHVFNEAPESIPDVPFYSQIRDISSPKWRGLSCGVADLAMVINFYKPDAVLPDNLLWEGVGAGAFVDGVGWSHQGLVNIARPYGFEGRTYDFSGLSRSGAFSALEEILEEGPVIASVYYTFNPQSPIPHLVVVNGVSDGFVYYNDPAAQGANQKISVDGFMRGWKKRIIAVRPSI